MPGVSDPRGAAALTVVVAFAWLFATVGSSFEAPTSTRLPMMVPFGVPALTRTVRRKIADVFGSTKSALQWTPLLTWLGRVHVQAWFAGGTIRTKVVLAGMASSMVAATAVPGPLFTSSIV